MDLCNNSLDLDFFFENGWLVNDNYFSAAFSRILLQEINFLRREGEFLKAGIGKGISFQHKPFPLTYQDFLSRGYSFPVGIL